MEKMIFSRNERKSTSIKEYLIGWFRKNYDRYPVFPDRSWYPAPEKGKEYRVNLTLSQSGKFFFATPAEPVDKIVIVPLNDDYYEKRVVREFFDKEETLYLQRIPLLQVEEEREGDFPEFVFEPIANSGLVDQMFTVKMFFPVFVSSKKQEVREGVVNWRRGDRQLKTKRLHLSYDERSYEEFRQSLTQRDAEEVSQKLGKNYFPGEFECCVMFKYTNTSSFAKPKEMLALGDATGAARGLDAVANYELEEIPLAWAIKNLPSIDQTKFVSIDDDGLFEIFGALIEFKYERRKELLAGAKLTPKENIKFNDTIDWNKVVIMELKKEYGALCGERPYLIFDRGGYSENYKQMIAYRKTAAEKLGWPLPLSPPEFIPLPKRVAKEENPHLDGWDKNDEDGDTRRW